MKNLTQRLNERLDRLQNLMETNYHLENPELVLEVVDSIAFAWSVLSEEDREYIHCCRIAIENDIVWKPLT